MSQVEQARATLEDLYRVRGKAELFNGSIIHRMPTGLKPNHVAGRIYRSLDDYSERAGGIAGTANLGFAVDPLGPPGSVTAPS